MVILHEWGVVRVYPPLEDNWHLLTRLMFLWYELDHPAFYVLATSLDAGQLPRRPL